MGWIGEGVTLRSDNEAGNEQRNSNTLIQYSEAIRCEEDAFHWIHGTHDQAAGRL